MFGRSNHITHSRKACYDMLCHKLTPERLRHSVMVETCAIRLAIQHNVDPYYAGVAGLMHDVCHCDTPATQRRIIRACGGHLPREWREHPQIWHALTGTLLLRQELKVGEKEILRAVRYHTTARAGMSDIEKVVFLADKISLDRDWPGVEKMREVCGHSLDDGMHIMLAHTVERLVAEKRTLVKDTWEAYNEYVAHHKLLPEHPLRRDDGEAPGAGKDE